MASTGRNAPCPCGSGKKHKKCCAAKPANATHYTSHDRDAALFALTRFLQGPGWAELFKEGFAEFWGDLDPNTTAIGEHELVAAMSEQAFEWWLFFDLELEPGVCVVDAVLRTTDLSNAARAFLAHARATTMRVYEVTEVRPDVGMTLRDVISGTETRVRERAGSREVRLWSIIGTRIMPAGDGGEPVLDGGVLPLAPMRAEAFVRFLREQHQQFKEDAPHAPDSELFKTLAPAVHRAWIEPLPMPRLTNFDGDELVLATVHFDVLDRAQVIASLNRAKGLQLEAEQPHELKWSWSGIGKDRKEPTVFGWLSLSDTKLELMTNSVERGERGRKLVERAARTAVRYRVTSTQDAQQALKAMSATESQPQPDLPHGELRENAYAALEQHLAAHYERWLDEPIPRLANHTPRLAVAKPELRSTVIQMLKELEHMYEKALDTAQPAYDPIWMWEELGLEHERDAPSARKPPPVLGHEALEPHFPGLLAFGRDLGTRLRQQTAGDTQRVVQREEIEQDLHFHRIARGHESPELANTVAELVANFELHLRKVFWIDDPLAWMLGATELDVTANAVRAPFTSLALVFTDRYALGLTERMLARLPPEQRQARLLQVLTVYVTVEQLAPELRRLTLWLVADALDGRRPAVVPVALDLTDSARIERLLDSLDPGGAPSAGTPELAPMYESIPMRELMRLVLNALLYATSPDVDIEERSPASKEQRSRRPAKVPTFSSETVFFLPGTIDITTLRQLRQARRGGQERELTRRCMVRGHWRRAPKSWQDQHPRWIRPHWRGPSAAAIVERQYRLVE